MSGSDESTMRAFTSALDADSDLIADFGRDTGDPIEFSVIDGFLADDLLCASGEGEGPSDGPELYFNLPDAGTIGETLPPIHSEIFRRAAQTGVTAMDYPNPTVVHIDVVYSSGAHAHGSGVMVGRNDVLTAGHVLYDPNRAVWRFRLTSYPTTTRRDLMLAPTARQSHCKGWERSS